MPLYHPVFVIPASFPGCFDLSFLRAPKTFTLSSNRRCKCFSCQKKCQKTFLSLFILVSLIQPQLLLFHRMYLMQPHLSIVLFLRYLNIPFKNLNSVSQHMNGNEAGSDLVLIKISLLFSCKSRLSIWAVVCYYDNYQQKQLFCTLCSTNTPRFKEGRM